MKEDEEEPVDPPGYDPYNSTGAWPALDEEPEEEPTSEEPQPPSASSGR